MINRNSKKPSCFPVILFYQNTLPLPFYDTILFLPSSTSLPPALCPAKSCRTPIGQGLFTSSLLQMIQSYIQSVLILLERISSLGENTRHKKFLAFAQKVLIVSQEEMKRHSYMWRGPLLYSARAWRAWDFLRETEIEIVEERV